MEKGKMKIILPILILIVGALITRYFVTHKLKAKTTKVTEKISNVEVMVVEKSHELAHVFANGTVKAAKDVQLKPLVTGNIVKISKNLVPGGYFRKGEVIADIEKSDYEAMAASKNQMLASAKLAFQQEKARKEVALKEWNILQKDENISEENKDLALRIPQFESAKAAYDAAKKGYEKALLDLERCTLIAPFNCTILSESVDEGQLVSPQTPVCSIAGTDEFWVEASIPVDSLPFINLPDIHGKNGSKVVVENSLGDFKVMKNGKIIKLLNNLSPNGRMARIIVAINDPLNKKSENELHLFIGSYVNLKIIGKKIENVAILPRKALRDIEGVVSGSNFTEGYVFLVNSNNRLKYRKVEIEFRSDNEVFINKGLNVGDKVVLNTISIPVEGLKLNITKTID